MTEETTDDLPVLTAVREVHRFDEEALEAYLQRALPDFGSGLTIEQYVGGSSNPTFLLTTDAGSWVLRKRPPGNLLNSAHQVDREHRVMLALRDSDVPVPKMHLFCEDDTVIGQQFYVMEQIEGRVTKSEFPNFTPAQRRAVYDDFARVLAALHSVDYRAVGLENHGRPGNYFARQISRWSKQYRAAQTDRVEAMEKLIEWMPENIPEDDETVVIHGDYRIGNVLIHPTEPKLVGVLDWELSTLGHPLGDLSYHVAYAHHGEFVPFLDELDDRGIPTEQEWRDAYCAYAGRGEVPNWNFYTAYNLFRLVGIIQGVYKRGLDGIVSSEFELDAQRLRVAEAADRAWELVETMS